MAKITISELRALVKEQAIKLYKIHLLEEEKKMLQEDTEAPRMKKFRDFAEKYGVTPSSPGKLRLLDFEGATQKFDEQDTFDFAMILANMFIGNKLGGMGWDDLSDTNSMWDFIHVGMGPKELFDAAKEASKERLSNEGMGEDMMENVPAIGATASMTKIYTFKLKHDKGTATIRTSASSPEAAKKKIMDAEGAPESAITFVG
jgi:hypothetical protein